MASADTSCVPCNRRVTQVRDVSVSCTLLSPKWDIDAHETFCEHCALLLLIPFVLHAVDCYLLVV